MTLGTSKVTVLLPRTRAQAADRRSRSRPSGVRPTFPRAARFAGASGEASGSGDDSKAPPPGPGHYETGHSDFSGIAGVVEDGRAAPKGTMRRDVARAASPPRASERSAPRQAPSRRRPASPDRLASLLDASQRRERDLRRQLSAAERLADEARAQLGASQQQTRQRLREAEALAARRGAVLEGARARVAGMRRSFADVDGAAAALCDAIAAAEASLGTGPGRAAFSKVKQLAFRLESAAGTAAPAFARPASADDDDDDDNGAAAATAAAAPSSTVATAGVGATGPAPPRSSALAGPVTPAASPPAPAPAPPPVPAPARPSPGPLAPGVDTRSVGEFARRTVATARAKHARESAAAARWRADAPLRRTVGPDAAAMQVERTPRPSPLAAARASGPGPAGRAASPARLARSPLDDVHLSVEQKVRYVFSYYATFGQRDKEAAGMRHTGWARFTRAAGIVPGVLSPADVDIAFSREVAHRTAGTQLGGSLSFDMFIAALADVATRADRGPDAAPDDAADHDSLRSLLETRVLPLFDGLSTDPTFVFDVVRVGAAEDLEAFAAEFLSDDVIRFFNENKGAFRSLFQRFAKLEDPGRQPRGSALSGHADSPSARGVLRAMQERHAGWQEVQRAQRVMGRWAFGQFITSMRLAPGVLNRRDLVHIFRQANRGVAQDDFPDALSYTEFVELLALIASSAYANNGTFPALVDRLRLLVYDMSQRGASFMGEEQRLVRSVSRLVKQRLTQAEAARQAHDEAAVVHHRSLMNSAMHSADDGPPPPGEWEDAPPGRA